MFANGFQTGIRVLQAISAVTSFIYKLEVKAARFKKVVSVNIIYALESNRKSPQARYEQQQFIPSSKLCRYLLQKQLLLLRASTPCSFRILLTRTPTVIQVLLNPTSKPIMLGMPSILILPLVLLLLLHILPTRLSLRLLRRTHCAPEVGECGVVDD